MANTISNVVPQLLVGALPTLREQSVMPRLVNRSIGDEARDKGDTIDVPIASAISARNVTAAVTHATNQDMSPTKVQVVLDQWKEASFHLSDKDAESVMAGTIPMQAAEAVKSLANAADTYILGLYKGVYYYGGTAGTTPFATNLTAFKQARTFLNKGLAPLDDRRVVLDPDAEGNALLLDVFLKADARGDQGGIIRGQIGQKLGADWFMNQNIVSHTAGTYAITGAGSVVIKATVAAGQKTVIFACASTTNSVGGTLKVGDIFTISGHAQPYVVTVSASVALGANTTLSVQFEPALSEAAVTDTTVGLGAIADHVVNVAFHRDAWAFASRPLSSSSMAGGGAIFSSVTDPISGVTLRLEVSRQYKQWTYSYDILYGAKLVRAQLASRILG